MKDNKVTINVKVICGNESFECELPESMYYCQQDLRRFIVGICDVQKIMEILANEDEYVSHQLVFNPNVSAEMIDNLAKELLENGMRGWNPQDIRALLEHKLLSQERLNCFAKLCVSRYRNIHGVKKHSYNFDQLVSYMKAIAKNPNAGNNTLMILKKSGYAQINN